MHNMRNSSTTTTVVVVNLFLTWLISVIWCSVAGGRFEVDERSGVVRTRGTDPFQLDMEYVLYVKAEDQNGRMDERRFQSTPEERLSIVGGKRAPQFYMQSYEAEIPENQRKDSEWVAARARVSFATGTQCKTKFSTMFTASYRWKPNRLPTEKYVTRSRLKDKVLGRLTSGRHLASWNWPRS